MVKKFSLDKNKINILLLEGIHQSAVNAFKEAGYTNIEYLKTALEGAELEQKLKDVHILGIRSRTNLTPEILKKRSVGRSCRRCFPHRTSIERRTVCLCAPGIR